MLVVFVVVLIFFGGEKLPELARGMGKAMKEFKKAASDVEHEFKRAMDEAPAKPAQPFLPPSATSVPPTAVAPPTRPADPAQGRPHSEDPPSDHGIEA